MNNQVEHLFFIFLASGYELRYCGGFVRDTLLNETPDDIDFATNATPEQMKELFSNLKNDDNYFQWTIIDTGIDHGTLTFYHKYSGEEYEITTLRKDVSTDGRRATVEFTDNWKEDAERRDFTINAMYMDKDFKLFDFYGGQSDLKNKVLRFVGDADERVKEDYLRVLRANRFASVYNFEKSSKTKEAITKYSPKVLNNVSVERVWNEICKAIKKSNDFHDMKQFLYSLCNVLFTNETVPDRSEYLSRVQNLNRPLDKEQFMFLKRSPEVILATVFFNNEKTLMKLEKAFSNKEKNLIETTQRFLANIKLVLRRYKTDTFMSLKNEEDRDFFKFWLLWERDIKFDEEYKEFPLMGRDLLESGYKQGVTLGQELQRLKQLWIDSRYEMTKEDLLVNVKKVI